MIYKLTKNFYGQDVGVGISEDGSSVSFLFDENNPDYQEYLKWIEEGNTPEPAEVTNEQL